MPNKGHTNCITRLNMPDSVGPFAARKKRDESLARGARALGVQLAFPPATRFAVTALQTTMLAHHLQETAYRRLLAHLLHSQLIELHGYHGLANADDPSRH